MPEWLVKSKSYRLLIEAAECAFEEECDCGACQALRDWAATATPPDMGLPKEGVKPGRKR